MYEILSIFSYTVLSTEQRKIEKHWFRDGLQTTSHSEGKKGSDKREKPHNIVEKLHNTMTRCGGVKQYQNHIDVICESPFM